MASVTAPPLLMTFEQFEAEYGDDSRYEYWFGRAVERSLPTIVHGLLQKIILNLLDRTGYTSASEVEMRVVSQAHPRPDVIAWKGKLGGTYPTKGLGVVVEILSENDRATNIRDHCQRYQEWGFEHIYLVEPFDRSVVEWRNGAQILVPDILGVPVSRIWEELELQYEPEQP